MSSIKLYNHQNLIALKPKTLKNLPSNITCSALNYLTHRIMLCSKEQIFLYDLCDPSIIRQKNYSKDLTKFYEAEVEIKSLDVMIMANIWVALVNKKSFIFFNDYLEFTRIYTISPNPLFSVQVAQRTNDLIAIREDRKVIRFWNCQLTDEISSDQLGFDLENNTEPLSKGSLSSHRDKHGLSTHRDRTDGKDKLLRELGYTFDVSVIAKKQIVLPSNRFIMKLDFSEEFRIVAVSTDNSDILIYSLFSGDLIHTLNFCRVSERDLVMTPHISIDQEILYYCDEKRIIGYDLSTHEEVFHHHHAFHSKIAFLHAERSTKANGLYILTVDEKLLVYSFAQKKAIYTFDLKRLEDNDRAKPGFIQKLTKTSTFSTDYRHSLENLDGGHGGAALSKNDLAFKDQISKLKLYFRTDMNINGLSTLIIAKPGTFFVFDVMSSIEAIYSSVIPIQKVTSSPELNLKLELTDHTVKDLPLNNLKRNKTFLELLPLGKNVFKK